MADPVLTIRSQASLWDSLPHKLQEAIMLEGRHILARAISDAIKQMYRPHKVHQFQQQLRLAASGPWNMGWHFMWGSALPDDYRNGCTGWERYWWLRESHCGNRWVCTPRHNGWFCEWILGLNCHPDRARTRARAFSVHVCSSESEIKRASDKLIDGLIEPKHPESLWLPRRPYRLRAGPTPEQLRDDWRRTRGVYGHLKLDC